MSMFGRKADNDLRTNDPRIVQRSPVEQAHALGNLIDDLERQVSLLTAQNAALNVDLKLIEGQRDQYANERNFFAKKAAYWQDLYSRVEERFVMAAQIMIDFKKGLKADQYAPKDELDRGLETAVEDLPETIEKSTEDQPQSAEYVTHMAPPPAVPQTHPKTVKRWYWKHAKYGVPENWRERPVVELKDNSPYRRDNEQIADIAGLSAIDMELKPELNRSMNGQHGESSDSDADYGDSLADLGEHPEHKS